MDLPWDSYIVAKDHPRYPSVEKSSSYQIYGKNRDWVIIYLIGKVTDEEEYESFTKLKYKVL